MDGDTSSAIHARNASNERSSQVPKYGVDTASPQLGTRLRGVRREPGVAR